jgi:hypothetical protein
MSSRKSKSAAIVAVMRKSIKYRRVKSASVLIA